MWKWGTTRKGETEQWRKRMTKDKCNKKVASGEYAFPSYDHPVWDTVGIKHMAEEYVSKFFSRESLF